MYAAVVANMSSEDREQVPFTGLPVLARLLQGRGAGNSFNSSGSDAMQAY